MTLFLKRFDGVSERNYVGSKSPNWDIRLILAGRRRSLNAIANFAKARVAYTSVCQTVRAFIPVGNTHELIDSFGYDGVKDSVVGR